MTIPTTKHVRTYAADPMTFFADLEVRGAAGVVRFGDVMASHQREWFAALAPALQAVAAGERPPTGKFFFEGTKGSGKDFCLAMAMLWLLSFTRRPIFGQVGAADGDQADELRKSAKSILRHNRWLAGRVVVQNWRLRCQKTESEVEIVAADVAGSHGARPDVLILNELHAIEKWEFAENLLDNASKVPYGLVVVATNAGFTGTDAFRWREMARQSARWSFHQFAQPAPWLDADEIEEARLRNSLERFSRLFFGQWSSGSGDALDPDDIAAAITCDGPLTDRAVDLGGWQFLAGLDVGIKHDRSALVVLGVEHKNPRIRLAWCQSWKPPRGGSVDLSAVERAIVEQHRRLHFQRLFYDPHQAQAICQRLRRVHGVFCEEVAFVGQNLDRMATVLMEVFRSRVIDLYDAPPHGKQLVKDLGRLTIEEKAYGQRLTAVADADGHADLATALAIVLPFAQRLTFTARRPTAADASGFHVSAPRGRRFVQTVRRAERDPDRINDGYLPLPGF